MDAYLAGLMSGAVVAMVVMVGRWLAESVERWTV